MPRIADMAFSPSNRVVSLGMPGRTPRGARQSDRDLLREAPAAFLDTTHFDTVRFPPPDWALEAFRKAASDGALAYTPYRGSEVVLESVAGALQDFTGECFDPGAELIVTPGTQAGLFGALSALIEEGDSVLLADPDYLFSERILSFLGARVIGVPLVLNERIQPDMDALEDSIKRFHPKAFVFSHPNNPTGAVYPPSIIHRIAELALAHGIWVVVDELYARLIYDSVPFSHLVAQEGMRDRTVTLFGPSKTESLSGYRLGIVAAPARVISAIEDVQSITSLRAPAYAQHVLTKWLRHDREWVASRVREFASLRDMTVKAFRRLPWLSIYPQDGTAYAWPDVSALGQADAHVATALLRDAGVLVSPGYQFGAHGGNHFRVCFARGESEWAAALSRLVEVLDRLARAARLPGVVG